MVGSKLLKSKIFISVLLISFSSSLLSGAICDLSHEGTEIAASGELNKIKNHYSNQETKKIDIQSKTDDCEDLGISIFIINAQHNENIFFSRILILSNLNNAENEYRSEKELYSKTIGSFSSSPPNISNKLYRLNSLFLI